jgi:hypothetical protein
MQEQQVNSAKHISEDAVLKKKLLQLVIGWELILLYS